jgi:hypothetical protein
MVGIRAVEWQAILHDPRTAVHHQIADREGILIDLQLGEAIAQRLDGPQTMPDLGLEMPIPLLEMVRCEEQSLVPQDLLLNIHSESFLV